MTLKQPIPDTLGDAKAERIRRNHEERIRKLQLLPFTNAKVILGVALEDGISKPIVHKLGRAPTMVIVSVPRGAVTAGVINEQRDLTMYPVGKYVTLKADGFGATILVDVAVI